ncbi:MAG: iron-sulfur cluster insertion protein ErpA [bacterium]|nr:iron-sulfur cluster insertion protein ErpA [bacterium]
MGCCSNGSTDSGEIANETKNLASCNSDETPVFITPAAVDAVKNAIKQEGEEGDSLRISVVGGGCSGFQYGLDFEKEARMDDLTLEFGGLSVFVDPVSASHLKGTTIDYISGLNGTGFKFNNPNAKKTCGCGSSFS